MRRLWLFPSFAVLAAGCPSDDTSATASDDTSDTGGDDDNDDSAESPDDDGPDESSSVTVDPDSSSDGGTDTTPDSSGDSSTTVAGPFCGDGTVDEGEECDDENMDNGDACSSECLIPFEVLWTEMHNGGASNQDDADDVVIDADGNIYVAGEERNMGTAQDVWVQQYMADGTAGWTFVFDGIESLDDSANAIAFDADGNLVVVGSTEGELTVDDILVLQIDVNDGTIIGAPIVIDGPGSGPTEFDDLDAASGVALAAGGTFIVAGTVRVDMESYNIWVAEIDPAAMPSPIVWEQTFNGAESGQDRGRAVHVADDGTVTVLGNQEVAGDMLTGIVLAFAADGTPDDTATVELDFFVNDFEADAEGNFVVVGSDEPGNSGSDIRTTLFDSAFAEVWTQHHDGPAHTGDFPAAVTFDAAGNVVVVGWVSQTGPNGVDDAWIGTYAGADGALGWADIYGGEGLLGDFYSGVAIAPDGDYVVVGSETVLGQQRNSLVRKYHPLP